MFCVRVGLKPGFWAGVGIVFLVSRKRIRRKQIILRVFFKTRKLFLNTIAPDCSLGPAQVRRVLHVPLDVGAWLSRAAPWAPAGTGSRGVAGGAELGCPGAGGEMVWGLLGRSPPSSPLCCPWVRSLPPQPLWGCPRLGTYTPLRAALLSASSFPPNSSPLFENYNWEENRSDSSLHRAGQERFLPQLLGWVVGFTHAGSFYGDQACLPRDGLGEDITCG